MYTKNIEMRAVNRLIRLDPWGNNTCVKCKTLEELFGEMNAVFKILLIFRSPPLTLVEYLKLSSNLEKTRINQKNAFQNVLSSTTPMSQNKTGFCSRSQFFG